MGEDIGRFRVVFMLMAILADLMLLNGLFVFFTLFPELVDLSLQACQMLLVLVNLGYLVSVMFYPVRVDARNMQFDRILRNIFVRVIVTMVVAVGSMFLVKISDQISRMFVILYGFGLFGVLLLERYLIRFLFGYILRRTGAHLRAVILGAGSLGQKIYAEVADNPYLGINIMGFFDDDPCANDGRLLGTVNDVKKYALEHGVSQIYCTLPISARDKILDIIDFAELNVIQFHVVPGLRSYIDLPVVLESVGTMPILSIRKVPLAYAHNAFAKRAFDFMLSLIFLVVFFPLIFVAVAIAIKTSSPGPVFFRQERTGRGGKNFYCYKFRSMKVNASADTKQATADDDRKTRVGDFLRRTSIDELPQFYNVLRGEMSVVGPRPHMKYHTSEYSHIVNKYMVRHFIKPGITGLAQVMGFRGETREVEQMEGRIMRDIWYIEHWTLGLDVKIIMRTISQAIKGDSRAY